MGYKKRPLRVQDDTYIPLGVIPQEQSQVLFDMLEAGCTKEELYEEQFQFMRLSNKSVVRAHARAKIDEFLLNLWRFSPHIDEVAVERAYDGDREVWLTLTHYERQIVLDRLLALLQGGVPHRKWPDIEQGVGLTQWADSVGENHERVSALQRRRNRANARS
jgi:hypothetical protein